MTTNEASAVAHSWRVLIHLTAIAVRVDFRSGVCSKPHVRLTTNRQRAVKAETHLQTMRRIVDQGKAGVSSTSVSPGNSHPDWTKTYMETFDDTFRDMMTGGRAVSTNPWDGLADRVERVIGVCGVDFSLQGL